jgi:hypothetical protein
MAIIYCGRSPTKYHLPMVPLLVWEWADNLEDNLTSGGDIWWVAYPNYQPISIPVRVLWGSNIINRCYTYIDSNTVL